MVNSINTNIAAYFAQRNIGTATAHATSSVARLSSGNRIVQASDDVAALASGTSLRTQVTTLRTALLNAAQGTSLLQVADGALSQITDILQRQKAIAIQAGSGSLGATERGFLNQEFQSLTDEINRISGSTNFNGVKLLNGGLGASSTLVSTDALAALFAASGATNTGAAQDDSSFAIESFDVRDGTAIAAAAAGNVTFVESDGTTAIANEDFLSLNGALYGQFSNFQISNVITDVAATITATINGVDFVGTYVDAATDVVLTNGTSRLLLTMTAAIGLADDGEVEAGIAALRSDFLNTVLVHTRTVQGVDFSGTRLRDVTGATTTGVAMARVNDPTRLDIGNFQYVSNGGADENILTVQVNGRTFTASGVTDTVADGDIIMFESGDGEGLQIDFTNLANVDQVDIDNIRTSLTDRNDLINALNIGFSRAGSGLNFAVGSETSDTIRVQLRSSGTVNLFLGQDLGVASASSAAAAALALDTAISSVTSIRADVGALQSRFSFASANLESSIQNQDAARAVLLDTDVASESTAYATAQVQIQAGIAVLAQANLLPQNLLKLIG